MEQERWVRFVTVMAAVFLCTFFVGFCGLLGFIPELQASEPNRASPAVIITGVSALGLLVLWLREDLLPKWKAAHKEPLGGEE